MMVSFGSAVSATPFSLNSVGLTSRTLSSGAFIPAPFVECADADSSECAAKSFDFVRKILDHTRDRIGRRLSQPANRRVGHRLRELVQEGGVPIRLREQADGLFRSYAAGRALAARLVGEELHQVERRVARAVVLRKNDHRRRAYEASVRLQRVEIKRDLIE